MPGLLRGIARTAVVAGTATHVANKVSRRQGRRWAAKDQANEQEQAQAAPAAAAEPEPANDMNDPYAEIEKLSQLKDRGILTQEEFELKKKQLLGI